MDQWQCGGREREAGNRVDLKESKGFFFFKVLNHLNTCVFLCQPVKETTCWLAACSLNLKNVDMWKFFQMYFATLRLDLFNQSQVWFFLTVGCEDINGSNLCRDLSSRKFANGILPK